MEKISDSSARDRRNWPGKVYRLGSEPSDDLSRSTSPEERLAMMWELAEAGWVWAGRSFPDYDRENMPGRVLRGCR
jgi:hypothetical protein